MMTKAEQDHEWYLRNQEKVKERSRKWYAANKERAAAARREWSDANPEKRLEYSRRWATGNPERRAEIGRLWQERNRQKRQAHVDLNNAIQAGKVVRQPCETCGERAQAHHEDYSKPLEVRWLCTKHHGLEHRKALAA